MILPRIPSAVIGAIAQTRLGSVNLPKRYAIWNSSDMAAGIVLSDGNLSASNVNGNRAMRSNVSVTTGKWYFEMKQVSPYYSVLGIGNGSASLAGYVGIDANGKSYSGYGGGYLYYNGGSTVVGNVIDQDTDVLAIALDADANTMQVLVNNTLVFSGPTGMTGPYFAMTSGVTLASGGKLTANFGASTMAYAPPAGYNAGFYDHNVDFSPLSLPSLYGWYDASDLSSLDVTSGKVTVWRDKSLTANHLSQSDNSIRFSSGADIHGKAAVASAAGAMVFDTNPVMPDNAYYAFGVYVQSGGALNLDGQNGSTNPYLMGPQTGHFYSVLGASGYIDFANTAYEDGNPHIQAVTVGATGSTGHVDAATGTSSAHGGMTITSFGGRAGYRLTGKIGEVLFGKAELTNDQIADIKAYLKTKWGTP